MAITRRAPNTIHLSGPLTKIDETSDAGYPASTAITPGMLVELFDDSGTMKVRPHNTDSEQVTLAVALDRPEINKGISDAYASGDAVALGFMSPGSVFYGIIPSGQNIARGDHMQSNGDGKVKAASATTATDNVARFQSLDAPGSVTADTRLRLIVTN